MFSSRSARDREPNELTRELEALCRSGKALWDLTQSNPTRAGIRYDEDGILTALGSPAALSYQPHPLGPRAAREAVAHCWASEGVAVSADHVVLTASTSEAYGALFKLLCDPGDEVLIPAPSYPLFEHLASFESVDVRNYPLGFDTGWYVDVDAVAARIGPRTRAIVLVSPNNPTGNYVTSDELARLERLGVPLISDEVFATFPIDAPADRARSVLDAKQVLCFALSGLSKLAALPQMKVAWTAVGGPPALADEALARLELILDAYLSPSTPSLGALPRLLETRHVAAEMLHARVRRNARHLKERARDTATTLLPIQGGWYAVLRLPATESEEDWVLGLLRHEQVLVQPGYFYDFAREPYAVVSLLTPEATLDEGIERLLRYVERRC
ncbi:MAG TPA: pyridoxal phosphate-dependent aminotransferase [Polyangiaceae bacterium]|nr:pyridoxal phosphate-dependent aminotransferase [Polyangiaceae bacterium]